MNLRLFKASMLVAGMVPGLAAAQPLGMSLAPLITGGTGLAPFYVVGFQLGPWQDYLAQELTPDYLLDFDVDPIHVSWLDRDAVMILPAFAEELMGRMPRSRVKLDVEWSFTSSLGNVTLDQDNVLKRYGLERQLMAPGIIHQINDRQVLDVAAVFAHQSFGVSSVGMHSFDQDVPAFLRAPTYAPYQETGYGTGVRLAVHSEVAQGMAIDAGFQSRIDMEEFASYRGVYSQPADLDIPARATLGLAFQASQRSWLNFSVERVMYSDVSAFASRTLPDRFLSLLGDSTSPNFSWDDLTVYSVGWTWSNGSDTEWFVDVSSRSQPLPTSPLLSRALNGDLAENAMTMGFSRRIGDHSRFNLNAAYAPSEYAFGGNVLGITTTDLDQNFELEAFWTWDF
ncbi:MAG: hypothetical protein R3348_00340 [Xanthomonadales bacterium]|nr:hypothetical protein [Xanthomonadales bacterium]